MKNREEERKKRRGGNRTQRNAQTRPSTNETPGGNLLVETEKPGTDSLKKESSPKPPSPSSKPSKPSKPSNPRRNQAAMSCPRHSTMDSFCVS